MQYKSKIVALQIFLVVLVIGIGYLFYSVVDMHSSNKGGSLSSSRKALTKEFVDSYDENIKKSKEVVEIDIIAKSSEHEIIDGTLTKVWSYNGTVPGPEIRMNIGETLRVNFTNSLPQETTVHWHGMRVPNAMDGVPGVTQDPIAPGDTFVYTFTPKDVGTFWFHPHVKTSEQMEKGLYGTVIVEDPNEDVYSQDKVLVIDDWLLTEEYQINPYFVTRHDLAHDGRWGNVITVNGSTDEIITAKPGERIRLRFVNASNGRVYAPYFSGLEAKVIAVDGMYVKEVLDASGFELAPGNRMDVDLIIPSVNYISSYTINDNFTRYENKLASINVVGNSVETSYFNYPVNSKIPEWEDALSFSVDKEYRLNARENRQGNIEWTINEKAFPDFDPFVLAHYTFNKIRFVNESSRLHPMHLHGQFFKVIARNGKKVNEPYFRDTVLVHSKETVDLGIVALDKGEWVQHCHILEHADAGMLTVITVN